METLIVWIRPLHASAFEWYSRTFLNETHPDQEPVAYFRYNRPVIYEVGLNFYQFNIILVADIRT